MIRTSLTVPLVGRRGRRHLSALFLATIAAAPGETAAAQASRLPAIPAMHGTLEIRVVYPSPNAAISAGDSIFVFGTVGEGDATLTIDGRPIPVAPNGAWLAWIPFARDSASRLQLEARHRDRTVAATLPLTRANWIREEGAWVDRASLAPVGHLWLPQNESLALTVRAAPGARVRLRLADGTTIPFVAEKTLPGVAAGVREFDRDDRNLNRSVRGDHYLATLTRATVAKGEADWLRATAAGGGKSPVLEVILRNDTTRVPWELAVRRMVDRQTVVLDDVPEGGPWRLLAGRPLPGRGTYTRFFPRGTWARAEARINGDVRLRLADGAIAWVPLEVVRPLSAGDDARPALVSSLTLTPSAGRTLMRIPLSHPVAVDIDEDDDRLTITLLGAVGVADWTRYGAEGRFVRSVTWRQAAADQAMLVVTFDRPLWGWRYRVDGSDLVFEFREPPVIDTLRPLAGRRIVVDAGHPPGGACGPTGYCEPEVNLAIARLVRSALIDGGAQVTMTRSSAESVALRTRSEIADSVDADLFVSIHNNAFPDGINPFTNGGTSTFYNHLPSLALARMVQSRLVAGFGLRDLGVARGDLAVVRPTWYPAILSEGMFLMVPAQEAALRTAETQQRYADGVVAGIRDFLRETGRRLPRK